MDQRLLSIGETAQWLGVSISTLRLWEEKDVLRSFRPYPNSKRYYRREDIERFLNPERIQPPHNLVELGQSWVLAKIPVSLDPDLYCPTNDLFSARLERLNRDLEKRTNLHEILPLIIAITGEIGNNSYNHNLGNWPDVPGIFFGHNVSERQIVMADRGRGILKTLQRVSPRLKTHKAALKVAFTQYISGRAPENRGNGLKFVRDVVFAQSFHLIVYTGNAKVELKPHEPTLKIETVNQNFHGCLSILNY